MVGDLCPTKGGDMLRMAGDPWTIVCPSNKVIVQLRLTYNDEIHFCFYIDISSQHYLAFALKLRSSFLMTKIGFYAIHHFLKTLFKFGTYNTIKRQSSS